MTSEGWGQQPAPIGHNSGEAWPDAVAQAPELPKFEVKYPGQPDTEEPEAFRARRNAEIQTWLNAKPALDVAKQYEMDCRTKVTSTLFPVPKKGTQRYDIGGGYQVKLQHVLTYTLGDKDKTREDGSKFPIEEQITALEEAITEKYPVEGPLLLKRLIKWKPEISGSEYEKLDPKIEAEAAVQVMISEHLTIKPGSPQLTFEEPKEPKA